MNGSKKDRRSYTRHPLTLFVDTVQFDPEIYEHDEVRTAYDLELTEYDAKKLYERLKLRIDSHSLEPIRIRVIGRLVS